MKIKIGTRRSRLAMWQTNTVLALINKQFPDVEVEIIPVSTLGDKDKSTPLAQLGQTGVFTKELEDALLAGQCDVAVNSFKDMATTQPDGLMVGAVLEREQPMDVLISRDGLPLEELKKGALVGSSSLRRRALLLKNRPDLCLADLRGNVPTRLKAVGVQIKEGKEPSGQPLDATVLAFAGIKRLGLDTHITQILPVETFLPAPAQGAVAIQIRSDDSAVKEIVSAFNHKPTQLVTTAERKFLQVMEGGCHIPLGALATLDATEITLTGIVLSEDGDDYVESKIRGTDPNRIGEDLAQCLLALGGYEILKR